MTGDNEPLIEDKHSEERCRAFVEAINTYFGPKNPTEAPEIRENTE